MKEYILLSYVLGKKTPLYGDTPKIDIIINQDISSGDTCNTYLLKMHNHIGTHIDAPRHFWNEGKRITEFDINELIFTQPYVIECPKSEGEMVLPLDLEKHKNNLTDTDILLIKTGFGQFRQNEEYRLRNPGISPETASLIRSEFENIRCVGIDSLSVSSFSNRMAGRETHRLFLQKGDFNSDPVLLIEDMNLSNSKIGLMNRIFVSPLMIEGIDSSPCTVIAEIEIDSLNKS